MIMMGVDPGTRYAGYAIIKKEKQKTFLIESGCLDVHLLGSLSKKIADIYDFVSKKVKDLDVTHLAIETPFLYKNPGTFLKLGYIRGVLYLISEQNGLILSEFSPSEVKLGLTGYGKATKEQVANIIMKIFRIEKPQRDDTTDAIAIALCGIWNSKQLQQ
jgi:crossover junction endodeoxyribonuclease RuvC